MAVPTTGRFEWHITLNREDRDIAVQIADTLGWAFSEISGCPILGQGTYCCITGFDTNNAYTARGDMRTTLAALERKGIKVLRAKIENIVFDSKTGVDEL